MQALPASTELSSFAARVARANRSAPAHAAKAGLNLVDGALRIRRGGDGIYGDAPARPVTKPAEAVGAWLKSIEGEIIGGEPFHRSAELREAVIAAAEEVDAATRATPGAERLRGALYADALTTIGGEAAGTTNFWPWLLAAALGGILVGVLITRRR